MTFTSCESDGEKDRREAMEQMRRLVAMLHGRNVMMLQEPGFPKASWRDENGNPTCSWRLSVLDVSMDNLHLSLDWKAPVHRTFDKYARHYAVTSRSNPSKYTHVFALVGQGTAFTEFELGMGKSTGDAEKDAILLMESKNDVVHWMEPGDIDVESLKNGVTLNIEPNYPDSFIIAFVDGAVWRVRREVPYSVISPFLTLEGAQSHDREDQLGSYAIEKIPSLPKVDGRYVFPEPN
jgi:hypothetical protein